MSRGRPKKEINQEKFEKLCQLQCTEVEICSFLEVSEKTLNAWCKRTYKMNFSQIFAIKRCGGLVSLRRSQFKLAEKSPAMAIWLGKQYLDQKDEKVLSGDVEEYVTIVNDLPELEFDEQAAGGMNEETEDS